jgi:LemA protein
MKKIFLLTIVLFAAFGLSGCNYNSLTAGHQNVKAKWSGVETAMQRRSDLIPNLVESAKMAGIQEQEVFGQIADARSRLLNAQQATPTGTDGDKSPEQKQEINQLSTTLGRLLVLTESYPQLRSNENFLKVQDELAGTENRIKVSRDDYNEAVQAYNTERSQFPGVLTASIFGFKEEPYFKADEGSKEVPKINSNEIRRPTAPANK